MAQDDEKRTWAESLCAQEVDSARSFHYYHGPSGDASVVVDVYQEIVSAAWVAPGATMFTAGSFVGEVLGRLRAARRGGLRGADELEPVRLDPELWEIKWKTGKMRDHRMYHAEPGSRGEAPALVGLRFHRKDAAGKEQDVIDAEQEAEMKEAGERYVAGVKNRWGHQKSCEHCLQD